MKNLHEDGFFDKDNPESICAVKLEDIKNNSKSDNELLRKFYKKYNNDLAAICNQNGYELLPIYDEKLIHVGGNHIHIRISSPEKRVLNYTIYLGSASIQTKSASIELNLI